jgi:hypothetical protein
MHNQRKIVSAATAGAIAFSILFNSGAIAQITTTVGVNSAESGTFSSSSSDQPNQFLVGGEAPSNIWTGSSHFTDALTSIVAIPSTSSVYQSNAVNGYTDNSSGTTAGVGGYFTSRCKANNSRCWGINPQVTDDGTLTGVIMYGDETDVDVTNSTTAVTGIASVANFTAQPNSAWAVRVTAETGTGKYPWKVGYETDDGAVIYGGSGLSLGATSTASGSYSQILGLVGIDTAGNHQVGYLQGTPSGGLNFSTTPGAYFAFYNGPVGLGSLASSTSNTACLNGSTYDGLYLVALCTSLRQYKDHINPLSSGITEIMKLTPVSYVSRTNGYKEVGFVAEDVERVDSRLSSYAQGRLIGVQYDHMVALLTKAVQEQQMEIKALQHEILELRTAGNRTVTLEN